ncbi:MAG: NAD(P)-binding domain-containing protein, partial [Aedoeadaptatus pacaensis]
MKKLGIIGAGKVGVSLGIALFSSGPLRISGYYSRSLSSAQFGAEKTGSTCFRSLSELVDASDVILIATPDDVIEDVWRQLLQLNISGKILCHTAGSLSSSLFFHRTTKD